MRCTSGGKPAYEIHPHMYSLIKHTRTLITALLSQKIMVPLAPHNFMSGSKHFAGLLAS